MGKRFRARRANASRQHNVAQTYNVLDLVGGRKKTRCRNFRQLVEQLGARKSRKIGANRTRQRPRNRARHFRARLATSAPVQKARLLQVARLVEQFGGARLALFKLNDDGGETNTKREGRKT